MNNLKKDNWSPQYLLFTTMILLLWEAWSRKIDQEYDCDIWTVDLEVNIIIEYFIDKSYLKYHFLLVTP